MDTGPEVRVFASFTFVVVLLLGGWVSIDQVVLGSGLLPFDREPFTVLVALVPFVVTGVAVQAARAAQPVWARTLGGAAVILGAVSCLGAVFYVVGNT